MGAPFSETDGHSLLYIRNPLMLRPTHPYYPYYPSLIVVIITINKQ
jgi:hypothetical protein